MSSPIPSTLTSAKLQSMRYFFQKKHLDEHYRGKEMKHGKRKNEETTALIGVAVISFIAAISSLSRQSSGEHSRGSLGH